MTQGMTQGMTTTEFKGFGGVRLEAEVRGNDYDPAILLLHGAGQTRSVWDEVAAGLVQAGRRTIALDLRGHGASEWPVDGRYELDAHVEDLRAVLAQLDSRPVVVAATLGSWIAALALADDGANLAAGLVLVDMPVETDPDVARDIGARLRRSVEKTGTCDVRALDGAWTEDLSMRLEESAPRLALPTLVLRGGLSWMRKGAETRAFDEALPDGESVEVAEADLLVAPDRTEAFLAHLLDFLERKQPRMLGTYREGSDARTLRDAMGCFATGITIVTARDAQQNPIGLTANSFTSLSLEPPLLLVCIANDAGSAGVLRGAEHFGINVLQTSQQVTSSRFASKVADRFAETLWSAGETGVPLLAGSLVSVECRREAIHPGGDHFILVGRVVHARFEPRRDPLLYFRGKYRRLHFA